MSMKSWTECGFGYPLYNGKNYADIGNFLAANLKDEVSEDDLKFLADIANSGDPEWDLEDVTECPVSWKLAEIINEKEGLTVFKGYQHDGDTDQEEYIGIEPCYPWQMNEKDKSLSEKEFLDILSRYATLLGITEKPDYFEAEYFG